jgi:osmotically-inducible protein OsmY
MSTEPTETPGLASERDKQIAGEGERALAEDEVLWRIDLPSMRVDIRDGVVTLRGHVADDLHRTRAETAARRVAGDQTVQSELVTDAEVNRQVAEALGRDPLCARAFVRVETVPGIVCLRSEATTPKVWAAAAAAAARVPQVRAVVTASPDDQAWPAVALPKIGSAVYAPDGEVGHLDPVVIDPHNRRVPQLIVRTRLAPSAAEDWLADAPPAVKRVVLPVEAIERDSGSGVFLRLPLATVAKLPELAPDRFRAPDSSWVPPFDDRPDQVLLS